MFELQKSVPTPPPQVLQSSNQNLKKSSSSEPALWPSWTSSSGSTQPWSRCPPCRSCGPPWGCLCWCTCSPGPSYSNACSGTGWPGTLPRLRAPPRAQPPANALWRGRPKALLTADTAHSGTQWKRGVTAGLSGCDVIKAAQMSRCCGAGSVDVTWWEDRRTDKLARLHNNSFCDYRFELMAGACTHAHAWISLMGPCLHVQSRVDDQRLTWQARIGV